MSTMALILFVLVLLAYVRNLVNSRRMEAFRRQIESSEQQLRSLHTEIEAGQIELSASRTKLHDQQAVIAGASQEVGTLRTQLQSIAVLRLEVLNRLQQAL